VSAGAVVSVGAAVLSVAGVVGVVWNVTPGFFAGLVDSRFGRVNHTSVAVTRTMRVATAIAVYSSRRSRGAR
jgi:hypothetical protein